MATKQNIISEIHAIFQLIVNKHANLCTLQHLDKEAHTLLPTT